MPIVWTDTQIVNQLDSGYHWNGTSWTYSFPTNSTWFAYTEAAGFSALSAAQQAKATLAIALWDDLIVPGFSYSADPTTANVKFSNSTTGVSYAQAYYPGYGDTASGSVWFNTNYGVGSGTNSLNPPTIGAWGWAAYVHELGHAIGVSHPGTYNGGNPTYANDALYTHDSQQYTIMSYFSASNTGADWVASNGQTYYAQTPMIDDIMAIQAMYGADVTTRAGDTVYGFNSNITGITADIFNFSINLHPVIAIWDGVGNDTLDFSGWNTPSLINLAPGSFSNSDMMTFNISIARGAWIENAIGGGGNDTLLGNSIANSLTGNGGDDNFTGGGGNDLIFGGDGVTDTAVYGGNFSDYSVSWNGTAYVLVDNRAGSPDGTDTVKDVEKFAFADQTKDASALLNASATNFALAVSGASAANENGGSVSFTITRSGDTTGAGSVNYTVAGSGGSPASNNDFSSALSGTVNFAANETSKVVVVNFASDAVVEPDEGFIITLSNPSVGSGITGGGASGTILNDDVQLSYVGTVNNDVFNLSGSILNNTVDISQGGTDSVTGGSGQELILLGAAFTSADVINGGGGIDTVVLDGNYGAGVSFSGSTMTNVENLILTAGNNYNLTFVNATIANSGRLTVDASALGAINTATVNGASEQGGGITFLGGAGMDVFTGGRGADIFTGNGGADRQTGGNGADIFIYTAASDSALGVSGATLTIAGTDTLISFSSSQDKIDLIGLGFGPVGSIVERNVASFTGTVGNGYYGAGNEVVVEYGASNTARVYIDANKDGALGQGDAMIQLTGVSAGALSAANFKFV